MDSLCDVMAPFVWFIFLKAILPDHYKVKQLITFMIAGCLLASTLSFMGDIITSCRLAWYFCQCMSERCLYINTNHPRHAKWALISLAIANLILFLSCVYLLLSLQLYASTAGSILIIRLYWFYKEINHTEKTTSVYRCWALYIYISTKCWQYSVI